MATLNELYNYYLKQGVDYKPGSTIGGLSSLTEQNTGGGSDSGGNVAVPTKEESEATLTEGMTDVGENKGIGSLGSMIMGGLISAINPVLGIAYSLADPNSMTRQVLSKIGFNPTTEGSIGSTDGPTTNQIDWDAVDRDQAGDMGNFGGFDSAAEDRDQSGGDASSTSGTDSAGDGGDGYATGGRVGFAEGSLYLPYTNFLDLLKGRTSGDFNEEGQYVPFNYQMYVRPEQDIFNVYNKPMYSGKPNAEQLYQRYLGQTPNEDFLNYINSFKDNIPTEDFSDYLNGLTPNWSPGDPAPEGYEIVSGAGDTWIEPIARTLFPQTNLQQIKETATSPTQYNIEATKDLVENLPGFVQPFAPAVAGVMSLPYDAIQAYQRMQPGSGVSGFAKAYAAERPLQSAYERFVGASGPLAENINKAVSNLNPFQQQQYMQYAANNPEQAREAAQRNQDFVQATQRTQQARGGRIGYLQGGLSSLLGNYYG